MTQRSRDEEEEGGLHRGTAGAGKLLERSCGRCKWMLFQKIAQNKIFLNYNSWAPFFYQLILD
jgi:hypothetical protein